jgi:hypothetical protein
MKNTETRIGNASKTLAKAMNKVWMDDKEMADRLTKALAAEMEKIRRGE